MGFSFKLIFHSCEYELKHIFGNIVSKLSGALLNMDSIFQVLLALGFLGLFAITVVSECC